MRISPLRQRMIDDMTARHFGEKTQKDYIRCVKKTLPSFSDARLRRRISRIYAVSACISSTARLACPASTRRCRRCGSCSACASVIPGSHWLVYQRKGKDGRR